MMGTPSTKQLSEKLFRLMQRDRKAFDRRLQQVYEKQLKIAYKKALDNIRSDIALMYERFGDDVTFAEMTSFNRLRNLEKQIDDELRKLGATTNRGIKRSITDTYQDSYYATAFDVEKTLQTKFGFGQLSEKQVEAMIFNPLDRIKWSTRNLRNIATTKVQVRQALAQGLIEGKGFSETAGIVKKIMGNKVFEAMRIVQTETHRSQVGGILDSLDRTQSTAEELGIKTVRKWFAVLDGRTRLSHIEADGQTTQEDGMFHLFGVVFAGPGYSGLPQEDINCRCTPREEFVDVPIDIRRDGESGEIIPYKTAKEWKESKGIKDVQFNNLMTKGGRQKSNIENMSAQGLVEYLGLDKTYRQTQSSVYYDIKNTQVRISDHAPSLWRLDPEEKENIVLLFTENADISDRVLDNLEEELLEKGFKNAFVDQFVPEYAEATLKLLKRNIF
ncbi:MAG: hypothetical protein GY853_09515 [PVC group bacterium]|nr:hypothetical protein [PVC group bacterium]